jgi:hypothetical protein
MKRSRILVLAVALSCGFAGSAMADWTRLGAVDVSYGMDHDTAYSRFGGGIDRLQLDARNGDVACRTVRATFGNGVSREIFSGTLRMGQPKNIDLPGDSAHVRKLDFTCRGFSRGATGININADITTYRDEWRRSPDWNTFWARVFTNWGPPVVTGPPPGYPPNGEHWELLGSESFEGRHDSESSFGGWTGQNATTLGLNPDRNARCASIVAVFANGERVTLDTHKFLPRDEVTRFDLPGDRRNLVKLSLTCHADRVYSVHIKVLVRK